MMKKLLALFLALSMVIALCACSRDSEGNDSNEDDPNSQQTDPLPDVDEPLVDPNAPVDPASSVDLSIVRTAIIDTAEIADPFLLETDALLNLYGITADTVKQSASFVTMAGIFPDEIILIEAVDEAAAATIQDQLQTRLDEVLAQSADYDADNYAAAQACTVRKNGNYVSLILSSQQADLAAVYENYVN